MKYKKIKKVVPFCYLCNSEIFGEGSEMRPYHCKCGNYEYDKYKNEYNLVRKKKNSID